jgi:hypothetical protein
MEPDRATAPAGPKNGGSGVSTLGGFLGLCLLFLLLRGQNPHPAPPVAVGPPTREPDAATGTPTRAATGHLPEDWHRRAGQMRST